jgi:hypothetical protein
MSSATTQPSKRLPHEPGGRRESHLARVHAWLGSADGRLRLLDVPVALVLLLIVGVLLFGDNARHGGFLADDWAMRSDWLYSGRSGFFGGVGYLLEMPNIRNRPLNGVYIALQQSLFGNHMGWYLAWAILLSAIMASAIYALLVTLRFVRWQALIIAGLVIANPAADSLRLWSPAAGAQLCITLAALGFLLGIRAFRAERHALWLHAASLAFFVASLLTYETALAVICAGSILVWLLEAPWRRALKRWAVDVFVLVVIAATWTSNSNFQKQDFDGQINHIKLMWDSWQTLLTTRILPFPTDKWVGLAPLLLVLGLGAVALWTERDDPVTRVRLRRWMATALGAALIVTFAYVMFVPAIDYYEPGGPGVVNRVNAVASIGWVLLLFSALMILATVAFRGRRAVAGTSALVGAGVVLLVLSWLPLLREDSDTFTRAFKVGQVALRNAKIALPTPEPNSTIFLGGQPIEILPGFPVFGNDFDATGAVRVIFHDGSLRGLPLFPDSQFTCNPRALHAETTSLRYVATDIPYGKAIFLDTVTGTHQRPLSVKDCRRTLKALPISPAYPPPPAA